jgi:hypothetical protein
MSVNSTVVSTRSGAASTRPSPRNRFRCSRTRGSVHVETSGRVSSTISAFGMRSAM